MFEELINHAMTVLDPRQLSTTAEAATVAAAILTASGNVYIGVSIETACSMGFCAEHAAAAAMITAGESQIVKMVAINKRGNILPPCGRCREFIAQLNDDNIHAKILINRQHFLTLNELLPYDWRQSKYKEIESHIK